MFAWFARLPAGLDGADGKSFSLLLLLLLISHNTTLSYMSVYGALVDRRVEQPVEDVMNHTVR